MPDYADILKFLAKNPPQLTAERQVHASLLELLAQCLRADEEIMNCATAHTGNTVDDRIARSHRRWVLFN